MPPSPLNGVHRSNWVNCFVHGIRVTVKHVTGVCQCSSWNVPTVQTTQKSDKSSQLLLSMASIPSSSTTPLNCRNRSNKDQSHCTCTLSRRGSSALNPYSLVARPIIVEPAIARTRTQSHRTHERRPITTKRAIARSPVRTGVQAIV